MIHKISFDIIRASAIVVHKESFDTTKEWLFNNCLNIDSDELEDLERAIKKVQKYDSGAFTQWLYNGDAIIYFQEITIENIAHESFHAVCHIMECKGFQKTNNGEEFAYPLGYLVSCICNMFNIKERN